jgi:hypothetical protein
MALPNTTPDSNVLPEVVVTGTSRSSSSEFLKGRMNLFDTRLYRKLSLFNESQSEKEAEQTFYPHFDYGSYVTDYYESTTSLQQTIEETDGNDPSKKALEARKKFVDDFNNKNFKQYLAARSFIHPYALVKLAGSYGKSSTVNMLLTYDQFDKRKFYEIDGDRVYAGQYSKTPTTSTLIKWGNESPRGKTPYCFQDFVFCKWWNKIENNRMITLRRYAAPVTDSIDFPDYNVSKEANGTNGETTVDASTLSQRMSGSKSNNPWTPLATAVTYFGEGTDNKLSDILSFSAKYNWEEKEADDNPIDITSHQNDAGNGLVNDSFSGVSSGLGTIAKFMGFMGEVSGKNVINLEGAPDQIPPDPYKNGPYENRILGPINVITNTYRRKRGLVFTHDSLKITFNYVSRPIAGINNKAVLLDLMSNILILTYSSGSWFGGMWKYESTNPAIYPWKYGDAMNKLYRGEIFGKDGAVMSLTKHVFTDGKSYLATFLPDAAKMISGLFKAATEAFMGAITGDKDRAKASVDSFNEMFSTNTGKAIQKVIAAKVMKGTTIPYIKNQRALLTGDPVGDWHLTIGNPLNPIAMIGNLIVKNVSFKWYDELGPDDFPIGFKATIELAHGLGRDRDAIESMFNRGFGRIYTLSSQFRSSADGETKIDDYTGGQNTKEGRTKYDETRNTYFGGGTRFIAKTQHSNLENTGSIYTGDTNEMKFLKPTSSLQNTQSIASYYVNPWQMGMNM